MIVMLLIELAVAGAVLVGMWKMFEKLGRKGWEGIVPLYNWWVLTVDVLRRPPLHFILCLIPIVGIYFIIMIAIDVAKGFGKPAIWCLILPVLGYTQDRWQGAPAPGGFQPVMAGAGPTAQA